MGTAGGQIGDCRNPPDLIVREGDHGCRLRGIFTHSPLRKATGCRAPKAAFRRAAIEPTASAIRSFANAALIVLVENNWWPVLFTVYSRREDGPKRFASEPDA